MENKILSAATEIQSYLFDLLDKEQAEFVSQQLQTLLLKAKAGEDVDIDILDLLGDYPTTRQWIENKLHSMSLIENRGYSPVPGNHVPPPVGDEDDPKPK